MRQVLLIIDVQPCFNPPQWRVDGTLPTIAS